MEYTEAVEIISGLFKIDEWICNEYGERYAVLDGDIEIRLFQANTNIMIIQAMFGETIENSSVANSCEQKLRYILQANFIQIIQSDDILSFDEKTKRLSVTEVISLVNSNLEYIADRVESFIRNVDFWDTVIRRKTSFVGLSPLLSFYKKR